MGFDIAKYRANASKRVEEASKILTKKKSYIDKRFWKPTFKDGVTNAVIRLLPDNTSKQKFIEVHTHFIQGEVTDESGKSKKKYFSCLCKKRMRDEPCAICDGRNALYKAEKTDKEKFRYITAKEVCKKNSLFTNEEHWTNVLVIDDKMNPENNGKVFIYKMPKTVFQLIEEKVALAKAYDLVDGFNLRIITNKDSKGIITYEKTKFDEIETIAGGEENNAVIQALLDKTYDLNVFIDDENEYSKYNIEQERLHEIVPLIKDIQLDETFKTGTKEKVTAEKKKEVKEQIKEENYEDDSDDFLNEEDDNIPTSWDDESAESKLADKMAEDDDDLF